MVPAVRERSEKNPAAATLGALGVRVCAQVLTPKRRSAIDRKAATKRWGVSGSVYELVLVKKLGISTTGSSALRVVFRPLCPQRTICAPRPSELNR